MEIWTQAYLDASRQTQLKPFLNDLPFPIILNGVVVMILETCAGGPGSNSYFVNKYLYTGFDYLIFFLYNLHNFSPNIINKLTKWEGDF